MLKNLQQKAVFDTSPHRVPGVPLRVCHTNKIRAGSKCIPKTLRFCLRGASSSGRIGFMRHEHRFRSNFSGGTTCCLDHVAHNIFEDT